MLHNNDALDTDMGKGMWSCGQAVLVLQCCVGESEMSLAATSAIQRLGRPLSTGSLRVYNNQHGPSAHTQGLHSATVML